MSKASLPFAPSKSKFVPAEFVPSSEVDGVPPRYAHNECGCGERECEECSDRLRHFRKSAAEVRAKWNRERQRKMKELGLNE